MTAFDATMDGVPVGVLGQQMWVREDVRVGRPIAAGTVRACTAASK